MIKVMFICHGNICRSPMAEFVMKDMIMNAGLEEKFYIESAAVSSEELGNPVYPPVRRLLMQHGISCDGKTARKMTADDYKRFDHIIAMDHSNIRGIDRIIHSDKEHKVELLMHYTGESRAVADPWYTRDFEAAWNDITKGCRALLDYIIINELM